MYFILAYFNSNIQGINTGSVLVDRINKFRVVGILLDKHKVNAEMVFLVYRRIDSVGVALCLLLKRCDTLTIKEYPDRATIVQSPILHMDGIYRPDE